LMKTLMSDPCRAASVVWQGTRPGGAVNLQMPKGIPPATCRTGGYKIKFTHIKTS
jgi:hypothetical protein